MRLRRNRLNFLVEPASAATGDIAFNLMVFFLICASVAPDSGRKQIIPKSESKAEQKQQSQNLEVALDRTGITINAERIPITDFASRIKRKLQGKSRSEDKIVVIKSSKDTPYHHWIAVTGQIEEAGGIITLQLEEERQVEVP